MEIITKKEARERGLIKYYTGKPCPRGHIVERYVKNGCCVTCNSDNATRTSRSEKLQNMMLDTVNITVEVPRGKAEVLRRYAKALCKAAYMNREFRHIELKPKRTR